MPIFSPSGMQQGPAGPRGPAGGADPAEAATDNTGTAPGHGGAKRVGAQKVRHLLAISFAISVAISVMMTMAGDGGRRKAAMEERPRNQGLRAVKVTRDLF